MTCKKCGKENPAGASFCMGCGARIAFVCRACGAEHPAEAAFCMQCGAKLAPGTASRSAGRANLEQQFEHMHDAMPASFRKQIMAPVDGENRLVTVLFADMSRSVATTNGMAPEDAAELVNRLLKAMVDAFSRLEGRIDRFLGDGALAVFGTPHTHENDPERSILAAMEIRDRAKELGLQITAGINTGRVYFGEMGTDQHRELTVMGPVVNLAARLQGSAGAGEIVIGETTQRQVRRAFALTRREVTIKGIDRPVPAYRVDGQLDRMEKVRGLEGAASELIGRAEELAKLTEAYELTASGEGQLACLVGEAGLGKSRLVAELKHRAMALEVPTLWLEGRCVELDVSPSYWAFADLFRDYFGLVRYDDPAGAARRVRDGLAALVERKGLSDKRAAEIGCVLGRLLGVRFGDGWDQALDGADSELLRNMSCLAIRDLLIALAAHGTVVVVLEDLHWADSISIEVISLLMEALTLGRLLVLCVYRPDRAHRCMQIPAVASRKCPERFAEVVLKELTQAECRKLIQSLLSVGDIPAELRSTIVDRAQGNPLFVEEVIRSLIDCGAIRREGDRWVTDPDKVDAAVPDTLQRIILSRIDRLDIDLRHLLQSASVIGRFFGRRLLEAVADRERKLDEGLGELEELSLIYQDRAVPEEEYAFKHVLARDAVYAGLVKRARVQFHDRTARAIEALYADALDEHREELAYHHEQAGNLQEAVKHLAAAGERALGDYALTKAEAIFDRALTLGGQKAEEAVRATLLSGRGRARLYRGMLREARSDLAAAYRTFRESGETAKALELAGGRRLERDIFSELLTDALTIAEPGSIEAARVSVNLQSSGASSAILEQALSIAERERDPELQVRALMGLGKIVSEDQLSLALYQRALDVCERAGMLGEVPTIHQQVGRILRGEQGQKHLDLAMQTAARLGMRGAESSVHAAQALELLFRAEFAPAIEHMGRAVDLDYSAHSLALSALCYFLAGRKDAAVDLAKRAAQLLLDQEIHSDSDQYSLFWLAILALYSRDPEVISSLAAVIERLPEPWEEARGVVLYRSLARLHCAVLTANSGTVRSALGVIEQEHPSAYTTAAARLLALGIGARYLGEMDRAVELLEQALTALAYSKPDLAFQHLFCAEAYLERNAAGDLERAREHVCAGRAMAVAIGCTPAIERLDRLMS